MCLYVSVCLSVCLCVCMSVCVSVYICVFVWGPVKMWVCMDLEHGENPGQIYQLIGLYVGITCGSIRIYIYVHAWLRMA